MLVLVRRETNSTASTSNCTTRWPDKRSQSVSRATKQSTLTRDVTFPSTQFVKLRKITYAFLSIRKRYPKTSGDNSKAEYYERIRPKVVEELKKKKLPYGKPEKFEPVVDYLKKHPKFMSFMEAEEKVNRPQGKRKAQTKAKLEAVRQQVEKDFGRFLLLAWLSSGNESGCGVAQRTGEPHRSSEPCHYATWNGFRRVPAARTNARSVDRKQQSGRLGTIQRDCQAAAAAASSCSGSLCSPRHTAQQAKAAGKERRRSATKMTTTSRTRWWTIPRRARTTNRSIDGQCWMVDE